MFNRKQKEIDSLNARCVELARMVKDKNEELKIQRHNNELIMQENEKAKEENRALRNEIDELTDTVKRINLLVAYDGYENNEAFRRKLKELTSDYQSIC
jgi:hypothetical protein